MIDQTKMERTKSLVESAENDCTLSEWHKFHISSCWGMFENCWTLGHTADAELWLNATMRLLSGDHPPLRDTQQSGINTNQRRIYN